MQSLDVKTAAAWPSLAGRIYVPHSEEEYRQLVALLDSMIDEVGRERIAPARLIDGDRRVLIEMKTSTCRNWRLSNLGHAT